MIEKKDEYILKKFGDHLRLIRNKKGLSLRDLSYRCSIDNSKISKIERGKINITLLTALELADALDISPTQLLVFYR